VNLVLVIALVWLILAGFTLVLLRAAAMGDRADERRRREHRARRASETRRRTGRAAVVAVALPFAGVTAPDASAGGCAGARSVPDPTGPEVTLCVINAERRSRGLGPLSTNGRLGRAARHHAADMVARRYFAHTSPGGSTVAARLRHVGYTSGCRSWSAGETLAWGSGDQVTPGSRVSAWIRSRPHRRILLSRAFREAGVGIAAGAPDGSRTGFTYTAEFGRRRC
jgi:uncharacterized protein YkwD